MSSRSRSVYCVDWKKTPSPDRACPERSEGERGQGERYKEGGLVVLKSNFRERVR